MSVYQQTFHPNYNRQPYQQSVPVPQQYPYQQPSSLVYNDPNVFRRDFAARLSELTVNNKNMIHGLSFIAHDNARFGDIVVQCLEAHIRRVPPWMKLPAFYLLDAMSKNIFDLYASKFSTVVVSLFLDSWREVDSTTRSKMEEMLVTWRTGAPNGKELFGIAPQVTIERTIWGNDASSSSNTVTSRRFPRAPPTITKSQVLAELEVTLAHKEKQVQMNPYDTTSRNHIHVLHQLRNLVEAGVSQEELGQILQQLRVLTKEAVQVPPPPPPSTMSTTISNTYPPSSVATPSQTYNSPFVPSNTTTIQSQTPPSTLSTHTPPSAPPIPVPSVSANVTANISALFNTLVKAGLVSVPQSTPSTTTQGIVASTDEKPAEVDHELEASREYSKAVLAVDIKLSAPDIAKYKTTYVSLLYEHQPLQCKQCALRFPNNPPGKKKMENHLDMHFKQNRKSSQSIGRGHSRSWFIGAKSWMDGFDDEKGKGTAIATESGQDIVASDNIQRDAELRASFVVVPPGEEAKNASCPICKETLSPEFLEDDEEWVWRNAVRVKEKIFHATCHAEIKSTNALATRLRNEATHSRSATPDIQDRPKIVSPAKLLAAKLRVSRSPTPDRVMAGLKRKLDEEDTEIPQRHEDSPPTKKAS